MSPFLPDNYTVPVSQGNYLKLQDGENNFRILSSAVIGYLYWNKENKPVRLKELPKVHPADIRVNPKDGKEDKIKHFWAFVIWNYDTKSIQIAEVTQKSIQNGIKALVDNKKWGDPKGYDITITKEGEGLETEYNVVPNPHSVLEDEITKELETKSINLEALFNGEDPFKAL